MVAAAERLASVFRSTGHRTIDRRHRADEGRCIHMQETREFLVVEETVQEPAVELDFDRETLCDFVEEAHRT